MFPRVWANPAASLSSATCRAGSPGSCGRVIQLSSFGLITRYAIASHGSARQANDINHEQAPATRVVFEWPPWAGQTCSTGAPTGRVLVPHLGVDFSPAPAGTGKSSAVATYRAALAGPGRSIAVATYRLDVGQP